MNWDQREEFLWSSSSTLPGNLDIWDPRIISLIAKDHHVIKPNNRGLGATTGVVPDSIEAMAEDAATFISALGLKPVDVFAFPWAA